MTEEPKGCASSRVEWEDGQPHRLVMVIPCPLKGEIARVEQLVAEFNRLRLQEDDPA